MTKSTLAIALAGMLVATSAQAKQAQSGQSVHVSYANLDLTSETGRQVLDRRIFAAARQVCDTEDGFIAGGYIYGICMDATLREARKASRVAIAKATSSTALASGR